MGKPTVGILSMQRVINYGSFLQAYALKELLLKNGAKEVFFIDIINGRTLVQSEIKTPIIIRYIRKILTLIKKARLIDGVKVFLFNKKLKKSIKESWFMLGLDKQVHYPLDMVVIGSDEVFNCCQGTEWGYTTQLYGDIPETIVHEVFSYAGSFGYTTLEDLKTHAIQEEITLNLSKLKAISVRDKNSQNIIYALLGIVPPIHVDPVLAYGYINEISAFQNSPSNDRYMIVYSYQDRINNKEEIDAIISYARKNSLKLFSIFCRYEWCDDYVIPENPIDVLRWFKFSECIVTDTFHGTIFSVITHSRFASLIRPSNANKLSSLLNSLELDGQLVKDNQAIASILDSLPPYEKTDKNLEQYREETKIYIREQFN